MTQSTLFSFDLGSNSIGWAVLGLDAKGVPVRIVDAGTRIFSDGRDAKSKAPNSVARREARQQARMRDRYLWRRKATLRTLVEFGLLPADRGLQDILLAETSDKSPRSGQQASDPYSLRARALDEPLPPAYIGRCLFQLSQRRGFKSNRKADKASDETGVIAKGISSLRAVIASDRARTYGEWLANRRKNGLPVRLRSGSDTVADGYAYYPERSLLEDEFRQIWNAQAKHHPTLLTDERREALFTVIFHQRPLKKQKVGRCSFQPLEERVRKAHPLFQSFRLYKEVNELELIYPDGSQHPLDIRQRDLIVSLLLKKKEVGFKAIYKQLKLEAEVRFNKDHDTRDKMLGDEVASILGDKSRFGDRWSALDLEQQWQVVSRIIDEDDPEVLRSWLSREHGLDAATAEKVLSAHLPDGHGRLGHTYLSSVLDELKREVIPEYDAARRCGFDPARLNTYRERGEDYLPKYQEILGRHIIPGSGDLDDAYDLRMGRISNPTVHIGLNQLQRVVNRLIRRHGKPGKIAVELARDLKMSEKQKADLGRRQLTNQKDNARHADFLTSHGQQVNGNNLTLVKLWQELPTDDAGNRICVYSGRPISERMLFDGSVDIDHILPWSMTFDDSMANKLLCITAPNRVKTNRIPADVHQWHDTYPEILSRAARLPFNKRWRFAADAMERHAEADGFLARQLVDTQYLSRMATEYLDCLFPTEAEDKHGVLRKVQNVRVSPGRLTELLRRSWKLNGLLNRGDDDTFEEKNRYDHRHHAIDAIVIGVTSPDMVRRISSAAARLEADALKGFIRNAVAENLPWQTFIEDVASAIGQIIVSHKSDHGTIAGGRGTIGGLHNDTAYGIREQGDGSTLAVKRTPLTSISDKNVDSILDPVLREKLAEAIHGSPNAKEVLAALQAFRKNDPTYHGIRRVRTGEKLKLIPIRDRNGTVYKGYKGDSNYCFDVWETLDGKWHSEVVSMFDFHQPGWSSEFRKKNPTARRVMRLHQGDTVAYWEENSGRKFGKVVKFGSNGRITFADPKEGGSLKARDSAASDPFKYASKAAEGLKSIFFRQVRIDEAGKISDPGPQDRASKAKRKMAKAA